VVVGPDGAWPLGTGNRVALEAGEVGRRAHAGVQGGGAGESGARAAPGDATRMEETTEATTSSTMLSATLEFVCVLLFMLLDL
jgi:hypothetical protein